MTTMLLDSASLYFRSFFGVPDTVHAPDGTSVNAVRGFLDTIGRLLTTYEPSGLVACLDEDWRPAFRVEAIASYKAHRVAADPTEGEEVPDALGPQVPIILEALDALRLRRVGAAGFEADDVIGTLARSLPGPVDVVTGDRDLFQLVDDDKGVRVLYTARGVANMEIFDDAALHAKYQVHGAEYADFAALRGDASDGLPGVAGIGEKTAAALIAAYGDLVGIRAAAARGVVSPPLTKRLAGKVLEGSDYLDVAPLVVCVRLDVPVGDVDPSLPTEVDQDRVDALGEQWNLASSFQRVIDALERLRRLKRLGS